MTETLNRIRNIMEGKVGNHCQKYVNKCTYNKLKDDLYLYLTQLYTKICEIKRNITMRLFNGT